MVKSHFFVMKKTNLAKFISHGKITFLCGEKNKSCIVKSSLFVVKKTNLGKFISHGKITFLCGEKNKPC